MDKNEIRSLRIEAEKAKLFAKYTESGHYRENGEIHRIMSPAEDMIDGLRVYLTGRDREAGGILAAAAISFVEKAVESDNQCLALVKGFKQGLASVGVLSEMVVEIEKNEELRQLQLLGKELIEKMAAQPYSTSQFLADFDLFKEMDKKHRNNLSKLKAAIGHALLDDEWVKDLDPEQKELVAADTRSRFMKPGEKFEGYHFRQANGVDDEGERINLQHFRDNKDPKKTYRLCEDSEFVLPDRPMRVMTNYEFVYRTRGEAREGVIAYAVYSKPRA